MPFERIKKRGAKAACGTVKSVLWRLGLLVRWKTKMDLNHEKYKR